MDEKDELNDIAKYKQTEVFIIVLRIIRSVICMYTWPYVVRYVMMLVISPHTLFSENVVSDKWYLNWELNTT